MHPNHCTSLIIVLPCLALLVVVASHSVVLAPQLISYDCIRVDTVLLLFHKWSTLVTMPAYDPRSDAAVDRTIV